MRHLKKGFKLGRTHSHRKATLAALSNALIKHKRITTTLAKARALRMYVEPIIHRAKQDTTHSRRQVFRCLQDKHAVKELFGEIAGRITDRPGGYTRIVKLGQRAGDAAEMAIIELVDYNDERPDDAGRGAGRRRTRRGGRSRKKSTAAPAAAQAPAGNEAPPEDAQTDVEATDTAVEETETAAEDVEAAAQEGAETIAETAEEVTEAATAEETDGAEEDDTSKKTD